ncbi:MAG: hypothetical protein AAGC55_25980, partial [Myxococcota bacterium]
IHHCKGDQCEDGSWDVRELDGQPHLQDAWGSGCDDIFVVGNEGTIWHYDGQDWVAMTSGTERHLTGVAGSGPDDVYAVGFAGSILHYDGEQWSPVASPTDLRLFGVVVQPRPDPKVSKVFFVGDRGTFLGLLRHEK